MFIKFKKTVAKVIKRFKRNPDLILKQVKGVVHIGANTGQERFFYDQLGLSVIWIEPLPDVFFQLQGNIHQFRNQKAVQALITDSDGKEYEFHVASNNGASSSIFDFKDHQLIWPDINFAQTVSMKSVSLISFLKEHQIDTTIYEALVMDTQGAELMILKGAASILRDFRLVKLEVPDFESYKDCCQFTDVDLFMKQHSFELISKVCFKREKNVGGYYDVIYRRIDNQKN